MKCYDWNDNALKFTTKAGVTYNLQFGRNTNFVIGDSATGKSYLFREIRARKEAGFSNDDVSNIYLIDQESDEQHIMGMKQMHRSLVIIDDGDVVLGKNRGNIEDYIAFNHEENTYLIFARSDRSFYAGCYADFVKDEYGVIHLDYFASSDVVF